MLALGAKAPAFSLLSTSGQSASLADFAGRKVVLFFYPRDNTPGCTREACDFRDNHGALRRAGAVLLGVSGDSLKSHDGFRAKYELPFELLVDAGNTVATAFGAYGEKLMYGKKVKGVIRSTFLIDERGRIAAAWSPVKVDGHAQAVLAALTGDSTAPAKTAAKRKGAAGGPKKASVANRTFAAPKSAGAGQVSQRAAGAAASAKGRGYRTPTRVKGVKSTRGSVK